MKLHIFGASGSGVTTLGQALAAQLNLAYFDSDNYFWLPSIPPFTQRQNPTDRNRLISEDLNKTQSWVLGGSIINWGNNVFPQFDLVVFLYLPQNIRIDRLRKRELERYGDVIDKDMERQKLYADFIAWASDYDDNSGIANRTLHAHRTWMTQIKQPILELNGDLSIDERIECVINRLREEKILPI